MGRQGVVKRFDVCHVNVFDDLRDCSDHTDLSKRGIQLVKDTNSNDLVSRPSEWPTPRLVAFSSMMLTLAVIAIFIVTFVCLTVLKPDLGDQSLLAPLMGALLVGGTLMAALGLIAGLVDLTQSKDKRGVSVLAVVINGLVALFVFSVIVIGLVNS